MGQEKKPRPKTSVAHKKGISTDMLSPKSNSWNKEISYPEKYKIKKRNPIWLQDYYKFLGR
jgi:hypothetical protein